MATIDPVVKDYTIEGGSFRGTDQQYQDFLTTHPQPTPQPAPQVPQVFDASQIGTPKINTPELPQAPSVDSFVQSIFNQYNAPVDTLNTERTNLTNQLSTASTALEGKGAAQVAKETELGIPQDVAKLKDLNTLIASKSAEYQNRIAALPGQGRGLTTGLVQAQTDREKRMAAVELSGLASVAQALQGNIALSQDMAQRAVDLEFAPYEQQIKNTLTLLQLNEGNLTRAESKRADEIKIALSERQRQLDEQKQNKMQILDTAKQAALAGADNGTVAKILAASDPQTALSLAAGFIATPDTQVIDLGNRKVLINSQTGAVIKDLGSVGKVGGSGGGGGGSGKGIVSNLTQSIIDNPSLFDDLTPTKKGIVISELQANDYDTSNLGVKGLSDTAIKEVSQTQKALEDLSVLKNSIEANKQYIGPISGFARLNPWSKARQVQADIDRVKQTVGKALEGGVLRKEDEEKYKKILPVANDTQETVLYKLNQINTSMQKDIENYKSLQQSSGRSLDVGKSLKKKGSTENKSGKTSTGNGYTITKE